MNKVIYRKKLLSVLHEDVYSELMDFWREVEEKEYDYKIFVSKKCFDLYKAFIPLFDFPSYEPCVKITDTAIPIFYSQMSKKRVLIIDDVFIHGRTSLKIRKEISNRAETADFMVFAKNNNRGIKQDISTRKYNDIMQKLIKDYNRYNDKRLEQFRNQALYIEPETISDKWVRASLEQQDGLVEGFVKCDTEFSWKRISDLIMKSLWCVNIPYSTYVPIINIKDSEISTDLFNKGKILSNHRQKRLKQNFSYYVWSNNDMCGDKSIFHYCFVVSKNDFMEDCKLMPIVFLIVKIQALVKNLLGNR